MAVAGNRSQNIHVCIASLYFITKVKALSFFLWYEMIDFLFDVLKIIFIALT